MNLEEEIFKKSNVNFKKVKEYGFIETKDNYTYEKEFLNNEFKAIINIDKEGKVKGKVIDLSLNEEYLNIRIKSQDGSFVNKVRNSYKDILIDIKNKCFNTETFIFKQTNRITNYIINKYKDNPEFLWDKYPGCGIFRNKNNNKWYAIVMNIDKSKIDNKTGEIEIINVKLEEETISNLINKKGYYKAYHMNKKSWITIILDDTLTDKEITKLIDESYNIIDNK